MAAESCAGGSSRTTRERGHLAGEERVALVVVREGGRRRRAGVQLEMMARLRRGLRLRGGVRGEVGEEAGRRGAGVGDEDEEHDGDE